MKKVAIYFDEPGVLDYPFTKLVYKQAYFDLCNELSARNVEAFIVRSFGTYESKGRFTKSWKFKGGGELIETGPIKADIVLDRGADGTFKANDIRMVNEHELKNLCKDKNATQKLFSELSPKTFLAQSPDNIEEIIKLINTDKKVFKPVYGWAGEGIIITSDDKRLIQHASDPALYPAILQEFIDSSAGIEGLTDGLHDFRVILVNGQIVKASIRKPKEGSLLANVSQGGSLVEVPVDNIPASARELVARVDKELVKYEDRVYSVDMVFQDGNKPFLVELNSYPGLNPANSGAGSRQYIVSVADLLANIDS